MNYYHIILTLNNLSAAENSAGEGKKWLLSHQGLNGTEVTTKDLASYVGEMPAKDLMNWKSCKN